MKKLLLTGAGGSIGVHFVAHIMHHTDWSIIATDSFRHKGRFDRIVRICQDNPEWSERIRIISHDLSTPFSEKETESLETVDYIINLASLSDVQASIDDPVPFIRNNVEITLNLLELARRIKPEVFLQFSTDEVYGPAKMNQQRSEWSTILPSNPYSASKACQEAIAIAYWRSYTIPLIITNCFDMHTRVMTQDGFKDWSQLREGELVWSVDENENLILTPVLEKVKMPGNGEMIQFKGDKIDQLVTPNHRMMIRKLIGKERRAQAITETHAENLLSLKNRVRIPLTADWKNGSSMLPLHIFGEAPAEIMAQLYGWFVSEGFLTPDRDNGICFGAGSEGQQKEIAELAGYVTKATINGRSVRIYHKQFKEVLREFGHLAENKKLPLWIKNLEPNLLRLFFDAAIAGDGSRYKSALVYYTKSWQLAQDMCEVGMKLGYGVRVSKRKTWNPRKTIRGESYIVRFRKSFADIESKHIAKVSYIGDVWCVKTKMGRVFVERNGIVSLSGQTMNNFGEMQQPSKYPVKIQKAVKDDKEVVIHTSSNGQIGTRYYLHSRNAADAVLFILNNTKPYLHKPGEADRPDRYNIVGDTQLSNLELAETIAKLMDKELKYRLIDFHGEQPGHDIHYGLDGAKLRKMGWTAPKSFEESMKKTIEWQEQNPEWIQ